MLTLNPKHFDFQESFPVPLNNQRRQSGRRDLLDQKEVAHTTDAERVAFLHNSWCEELQACHVKCAYLLACIDACVDPGTGKPPRAPEAWPVIEIRARAEVLRHGVTICAILSDYADHFGPEASELFAAFTLATAQALSDIWPPKRPLSLFADELFKRETAQRPAYYADETVQQNSGGTDDAH